MIARPDPVISLFPENGENFDFAHICNDAFEHEDYWRKEGSDRDLRAKIWSFWDKIPEASKGWLTVESLIPYEKIIAIDEDGDEYVSGPHIYVPFLGENGPFAEGLFVNLKTNGYSGRECSPKWENRVEYFPEDMRVKYDKS